MPVGSSDLLIHPYPALPQSQKDSFLISSADLFNIETLGLMCEACGTGGSGIGRVPCGEPRR